MRNHLVLTTAAPASLTVAGDDGPSFDRHWSAGLLAARSALGVLVSAKRRNFLLGTHPSHERKADQRNPPSGFHTCTALPSPCVFAPLQRASRCNAQKVARKKVSTEEVEVVEVTRTSTASTAAVRALRVGRCCARSGLACLQRRRTNVHAFSAPPCRTGTCETERSKGCCSGARKARPCFLWCCCRCTTAFIHKRFPPDSVPLPRGGQPGQRPRQQRQASRRWCGNGRNTWSRRSSTPNHHDRVRCVVVPLAGSLCRCWCFRDWAGRRPSIIVLGDAPQPSRAADAGAAAVVATFRPRSC